MTKNYSDSYSRCIQEQYESIAFQYPNNIAVVYEQRRLSYTALNQQANQVANFILSHGIKPGSVIALFIERSIEVAVAYLAILKAGCTVVPLDSDDISERQHFILEDAKVGYIVSQQSFAMHFSQAEIKPTPIYIDHPLVSTYSIENIVLNSYLTSPAIIVYTSGSTGKPKGVIISHANLSHYVSALQNTFEVTQNDIYLHRGNISLIVSVRQLLMPLAIGATVIIATKYQTQHPLELLKLVKAEHVTIFDHVPAFWKSLILLTSNFSKQKKSDLFDLDVRLVAVGGDVVKHYIARFFFDNFKTGTKFRNIYGQTEGTGVVSSHVISESDFNTASTVPIGKAVSHMQVYIVNNTLMPVNKMESGEIVIAGDGVALGYLNQLTLTDEKFFFLPLAHKNAKPVKAYRTGDLGRYCKDGNIEFLGRIDNQVNINGRTLFLDEIQIALSLYPLILEAQIVVRNDQFDMPTLLAYMIPSSTEEPEPEAIREFLLGKLPKYLIPAKYIMLTAFPLTSSGKVNRQALQSTSYLQLSTAKMNKTTPINDLQFHLKTIWEKVLETPNISINDNFFNLGGDSLKAIQLITAIEQATGYTVPISAIQELSTIEHMANLIDKLKNAATNSISHSLTNRQQKTMLATLSSSGIAPLNSKSLLLIANASGQKTPLFWCFNTPKSEMAALAKHLPTNQPIYGLISSVPLDKSPNTLLKVAAHYVDELLILYPNGPFILGGNCRGAKVICEMYNLLKQRNIPIHKICLLEFFHPWLYQFDGDLSLLFGKQSHLKRHKLLKWNEDGWEKPFKKIPEVGWVDCKHGMFFNNDNIGVLATKVKQLIDR